MIVIVEYNSRWPEIFEALRATIWPVVADVALSIEHVGSTAVPGLAAKPIIDLDVVVPDGKVAEGIVRLNALGYEHRGDLGIPGREAFRSPAGSSSHHLYMCVSNSTALQNHLAIRDHLRANPAAARAYADLKRRLAHDHRTDMDRYVRAKTTFLVSILREVAMPDAAIAEIERVNLLWPE